MRLVPTPNWRLPEPILLGPSKRKQLAVPSWLVSWASRGIQSQLCQDLYWIFLLKQFRPPIPVSSHPFAAAHQARVNEAREREHVLNRSYFPRFNFQASVFGRGSGANTDGSVLGGSNGLNLQRENWATGLSISFPMFDIFSIRAEKSIEAANERAETPRYDQAIQDPTGQLQQIQATLEAARRIAQDTPAEVAAARATESQSRARYQAGLATIIEVAEAQSLLVQAETDDALARLAVWSDLASLSAAQGDLGPFLQYVRQKTQGGP
jgi:outer membrane protein